jgi:hypothetical protein
MRSPVKPRRNREESRPLAQSFPHDRAAALMVTNNESDRLSDCCDGNSGWKLRFAQDGLEARAVLSLSPFQS